VTTAVNDAVIHYAELNLGTGDDESNAYAGGKETAARVIRSEVLLALGKAPQGCHEIVSINGDPGAAELTATGSRACGGSGVRPPVPAGSGRLGGPTNCAHGVPLTMYDATNTSADCQECAKECLAVVHPQSGPIVDAAGLVGANTVTISECKDEGVEDPLGEYALELEAVLTELLRLYDWRNEIGRVERDFNHDRKQVKTWLNQYGREKKVAWIRAREVLDGNPVLSQGKREADWRKAWYCGRCDKDTPTTEDGKCPVCTKYKVLPPDLENAQGKS
jgi:rubrerythrin